MINGDSPTLVNREISWLSFNERVLQEAMDESNPLIERVRFLGIYSNNRDEFYRVRIASIKRMLELGKLARKQLYDDPEELLNQLQVIISKQEKAFGKVYNQLVNKELKKEGIFVVDETQLSQKQEEFVLSYFKETVRPTLVPIMLSGKSRPDIVEMESYLAVKLYDDKKPSKVDYALIEIPAQIIPRFLILPIEDGKKYVMFLDDVIRLGLSQVFKLFDYPKIDAFSIKLTRDAELDIDEDIDESIIDKLTKSVSKRKKAQPVRFIYDEEMPEDFMNILTTKLKLVNKGDIVSSGRYRNLKDLISFPNIGGRHLTFRNMKPQRHPELNNKKSLIEVIRKKDILLNYPFQTFSHTIDILREAAIDPKVSAIKISLYRISKNSAIINALINASKNGKSVTVIVELRARFDEQNNINVAKKLQNYGAKVIFGVEGLKVHSKLILIVRKEKNKKQYIAHVGSGNFHERNAEIYTDLSLWTADQKIAKELNKIFDFFKNNYKRGTHRELLVSPFNARRKIYELIDNEIKNVENGLKGNIIVKLNNLVDENMINRLYKASSAGVHIQLIVRGICSLVPGIKNLSENIEVISILDRYLEHSRILVFENGGDPRYYVSSSDWMTRNLDRRIEVSVPVHSKELQKDLQATLDIMLSDNQKARVIDPKQKNKYKSTKGKSVRSQVAIYNYYKTKSN